FIDHAFLRLRRGDRLSSPGRRFLSVTALTFVLSVALGFASGSFLGLFNVASGFIVLIVVIFIGVLFDVIGVAATAAREEPFHAMAADKVPGSREGMWLVRHADRVSIFANDIVGDVTGTLSGAIAAALAVRVAVLETSVSETVVTTLLLALVAAVTVGGKAYGKRIAIQRATDIVLFVGRLVHRIQSPFGLRLMWIGNNRGKGKGKRRGEGTWASRKNS